MSDRGTPKRPRDFVVSATLNTLLDETTAAERDREALVAGDMRMSYRELRAIVLKCASALRARGVIAGDRVAILAAPRPESVILFWACVRIGAIFVGFGTRYREAELRYIVADADPTLLFGTAAFETDDYRDVLRTVAHAHGTELVVLERWTGSQGVAPSFERFLSDAAPTENYGAVVESSTPAALIYTSGSTGHPKGVLLSHDNILAPFRGMMRVWPLDNPRIIGFMPIDHIGSIGSNVVAPVAYRGTLVQRERFSPGDVLETIERERITLWPSGIPTMISLVLGHPAFPTTDLSSLELMWWTGPVTVARLETLQRRVKKLATGYGMTETSGASTMTATNPSLDILSQSVGRPADGIHVTIRDDSGSLCAPGTIGEILVRGPSLMLGYWGRPDETARAMTDNGWLRTGDLGTYRDDGNLQIVGRAKETIRSGGYNIAPPEVERVLEDHPDVATAAVVGLPDHLYGEAAHAVVSLHPGTDTGTDLLRAWCRTHLSNYKVPKSISLWPQLPLLPNAKIDKKKITATLKNLDDRKPH